MKFTKKTWIAVISICCVACGGCIFASINSNISKNDINKASKEIAKNVLGGTLPDVDVKWELKQAMKQLGTVTETTATTTVTTATETVTTTSAVSTNADENSSNPSNPSNPSGSSSSSKQIRNIQERVEYTGGDLEKGVLYEATVVSVKTANCISLDVKGGRKTADFKYLLVCMPEYTSVDNVLEYIPEDEIENIEEIRQNVLNNKNIKEENKNKIKIYDIVCNKLKQGDTVYVEFDENIMPDLPSDNDYFVYLWYFENEEDKANGTLSLFQEWLLNRGYTDVFDDTENQKYLEYFKQLADNADQNFAGLWNGYFKRETDEEKMKKIAMSTSTEPVTTDIPETENAENQTETTEITQMSQQ